MRSRSRRMCFLLVAHLMTRVVGFAGIDHRDSALSAFPSSSPRPWSSLSPPCRLPAPPGQLVVSVSLLSLRFCSPFVSSSCMQSCAAGCLNPEAGRPAGRRRRAGGRGGGAGGPLTPKTIIAKKVKKVNRAGQRPTGEEARVLCYGKGATGR